MIVTQKRFTFNDIASLDLADLASIQPGLVLAFGSRNILQSIDYDRLIDAFKDSIVVGCSTSGEIFDTEVTDDSLVISALHFDKVTLAAHRVSCTRREDSLQVGKNLGEKFQTNNLRHLLVLSEGLTINGSALVEGLQSVLPSSVSITGGLSGDGPHFERTEVLFGRELSSHTVCAIGFYGEALKVSSGSVGGWDPFGPERRITRSEGNVLLELDNEPALLLYKRYLADQAKDLPASGLLFPLSVRQDSDSPAVVRTLLAVDEKQQSLTFAGDLPHRGFARLMKANFDRLVTGAVSAAEEAKRSFRSSPPKFALLISCVGRKLILKQRIEEEVEGVREVLGETTQLAGFYSYGEISPFGTDQKCELHNQTMTITTFDEQ